MHYRCTIHAYLDSFHALDWFYMSLLNYHASLQGSLFSAMVAEQRRLALKAACVVALLAVTAAQTAVSPGAVGWKLGDCGGLSS
jgi:hypothetical protein